MTIVAAEDRPAVGATHEDIERARQSRAEAEEIVARTKTFQSQVLEPLWSRMTRRAVQNSFGEEYDLSLQPRGGK